jgi:hypothetical protein
VPGGTQDPSQSPDLFTYGTVALCGAAFQRSSVKVWIGNSGQAQSRLLLVLQPPYHNADWLGMIKVWAPPRSLATTKGILSFPAGTKMFQFPAYPSGLHQIPVVSTGGLPHSDIRASSADWQLDPAFRSLSRPSSVLFA